MSAALATTSIKCLGKPRRGNLKEICTRPYEHYMNSLYTSPSALGRSRWSGCATDKNNSTGFGPRSFSVAGPLAWNSLLPEMKTTSLTLGQFSSRLKTEMFLRSYYSSAQPSEFFYYKTAWNINTVTELNWTELNWTKWTVYYNYNFVLSLLRLVASLATWSLCLYYFNYSPD